MTIMCDWEIADMCDASKVGIPMISPFKETSVKLSSDGYKMLSSGLSSAGYDVTLAREVKVFSNLKSAIIDPKEFSDDCLMNTIIRDDGCGEYVILPPQSYLLGYTVETFNLSRDVVAVAVGKSTYARCGIAVNVTPIEPGFNGQVVIEIANQTSLPAKIYLNEGISQFMFHRIAPCQVSYSDRSGKYNGQSGLTLSKV